MDLLEYIKRRIKLAVTAANQ